MVPSWLPVPTKPHGTEPSAGPKGTAHEEEQTGHGWSLGAYLGKRLYHCVQEGSHSGGHFKQFQHYNENQIPLRRVGKYSRRTQQGNLASDLVNEGSHLSCFHVTEMASSLHPGKAHGKSNHPYHIPQQLTLVTLVKQTQCHKNSSMPSKKMGDQWGDTLRGRKHHLKLWSSTTGDSPPVSDLVWYWHRRTASPGLNQRPI